MNEDKLRDAFEKEYKLPEYLQWSKIQNRYVFVMERSPTRECVCRDFNRYLPKYKAGAESQQPEIDELKDVTKILADYINNSMWNAHDLLTQKDNALKSVDEMIKDRDYVHDENEKLKKHKQEILKCIRSKTDENNKLRKALDRIGLLAKNLETDSNISFGGVILGCYDICQIAIEALKGE